MNTEIKLPGGSVLKITPSPFAEAKALFTAVMEEAKTLRLDPKADVDVNFFKDIFCLGASSRKIDAALAVCMKRATYNDNKIEDDTWEPLDAREDYLQVCYEVARVNLLPFTKSLYAQYAPILEILRKSLA